MKCPYCRSTKTEVYNSRSTKSAEQIWRRRRCLSCEKTFTTYEAADLGFLHVTAPSGTTRPYSRSKLFSSLYAAFDRLPGQNDTIDAVTDTVEAKILDRRQTQLPSADIAEIVLITLKHFHQGAFLRYLGSHAELPGRSQLRRELGKYK